MNNMTFDQAATVLNGIVQQLTGQAALTTIATPEDFVTVAQTALKGGLDPVPEENPFTKPFRKKGK